MSTNNSNTQPDPAVVNSLWVVIPAYNEGPVIQHVIAEVRRFYDHVALVDDGSSDDTANCARTAGAVVVRHPINLGQGAALQTGIEFALRQGAKFIVTFDADGQHEIRDVLPMVHLLQKEKLDVVLGSRFIGKVSGMTFGRRMLLGAAILFTRLTTGLQLTDAHNGLRVFSGAGARKIRLFHNRMAHASEILEQIAQRKLAFREFGNTVRYTDYSRAKGQKASNAINIVIDLVLQRLSK
ncbi:glycosyltransferase family 2 protein [Telluria sp. B2]